MEMQSSLRSRSSKNAPLRTFLLEPFDIGMHRTDTGVASLQSRFTAWLSSLKGPARFICWLMPATLDDKIAQISHEARAAEQENSVRNSLLIEYRRHYESLQEMADYQRS